MHARSSVSLIKIRDAFTIPPFSSLLDSIRSNYVNRLDNIVISISYYINQMNDLKQTCTIYVNLEIILYILRYKIFCSFKRRVSISLHSDFTHNYMNARMRIILRHCHNLFVLIACNYFTRLSINRHSRACTFT